MRYRRAPSYTPQPGEPAGMLARVYRLPVPLVQALDQSAIEHGLWQSHLVALAVEDLLDRIQCGEVTLARYPVMYRGARVLRSSSVHGKRLTMKESNER